MTFHSRIYKSVNTQFLYEAKVGGVFTQEERYKGRSPYRHHTISIQGGPGSLAASSCDVYVMPTERAFNLLEAKAYDRFVDKLRDGKAASLGASVAEGRGALEMIARRAIMLRNAWKAVRRGDVVGAAKHLGVPPDSKRIPKPRGGRRPGKVSKKHYASATWLELHFGWSPLLGDIHDAIDVLQSDFGRTKIVASASQAHVPNWYSGPFLYGNGSGRFGVRLEGELRIDNPNLALATSMGLTNPAAIAWELVPFSFVVDWFTNVGQILESFTDFLGYTWLGGTRSRRCTCGATLIYFDAPQQIALQYQQRYVMAVPPTPPLVFKSPLGGFPRAATQIALLTQLFLKP